MSCRIRSNECENWGQHSDKTGEASIAPISTVGEFGEDCFCCAMGRQNPERNEDGEEASKVKEEDDSFNQWQTPGKIGVENNREKADGYGE